MLTLRPFDRLRAGQAQGSSPAGLITDVIEFSAVDGPGNRFVVFTQGCNLDCIACHNPYTINPCIDCGDCVASCPSGALSIDLAGTVLWDADSCTGGDTCLDVCEYDSTRKARTQSVADVLARLRPAAPFLSGVTVSGGEATQQAGFVRALFAAIKADPALARLTCFIDTNGDADQATWDLLDPVLDAAMVDLKCFDDAIHQRMTGAGNERILASIRRLSARGKLHEVRLLLLPGVNDDEALLAATAGWLAEIDPAMRVKVIGFRHHGVRPSPIPLREPSRDQLEYYAEVLLRHGAFDVVVV